MGPIDFRFVRGDPNSQYEKTPENFETFLFPANWKIEKVWVAVSAGPKERVPSLLLIQYTCRLHTTMAGCSTISDGNRRDWKRAIVNNQLDDVLKRQ
jgi:hypothetical protein